MHVGVQELCSRFLPWCWWIERDNLGQASQYPLLCCVLWQTLYTVDGIFPERFADPGDSWMFLPYYRIEPKTFQFKKWHHSDLGCRVSHGFVKIRKLISKWFNPIVTSCLSSFCCLLKNPMWALIIDQTNSCKLYIQSISMYVRYR